MCAEAPESRYQSEVLAGAPDEAEARWRAVCSGPMSQGWGCAGGGAVLELAPGEPWS